jgi:hypothetical protein
MCQKLIELGLYTDDILVEYVAAMLNNKKSADEILDELNNVLNEPQRVQVFVAWLFEASLASAPTVTSVQVAVPMEREPSPVRRQEAPPNPTQEGTSFPRQNLCEK